MNNKSLSTIEGRSDFFSDLYLKAFPLVAQYVSKMGGDFEEAQDIFQDALVAYYEKIVSGKTKEIADEKAYLLGISKNLWLQRFKKSGMHQPLEGIDVADHSEEQPSGKKILMYLSTAGKKCMNLLRGFYYDQMSADDIAEQFGYSGIRSATVGKYKCLEKIREAVKQKSLQYADFIEEN